MYITKDFIQEGNDFFVGVMNKAIENNWLCNRCISRIHSNWSNTRPMSFIEKKKGVCRSCNNNIIEENIIRTKELKMKWIKGLEEEEYSKSSRSTD